MGEATINSNAINTLLDSIPQCILFTDLEGNITSFNTKAKEEFFTISKKNLSVGKSIFDYIAASTNAQFNHNFKKVKNGGDIVEDKYHFKTSAGKLIIFQFSLAPVYNQSVINQLCVTGHRVSQLMESDQRNIDQLVLENERKYRSVIESSIDAILLTKPAGEILSANAAACTMFGLSEKEICERGRGKLVDITDPNLEKLLMERSRTGSVRGELTLIRNDGTKFPGEVSSAIFTDVDGIQKTSMVIRDVSERKTAELRLRKSEERYRILFEQNLYGLYRSTSSGKIVECNEAFAKMLKYDSAEELMKTNAFELYFSADDRNQFVNDILKNLIKSNYEGIGKCKDGTPLFYIENASVQKDAKTGETFFDGIVIDITKRKLAELKLKETNERYNYVGKATTDVIWDWDIKNKELFLGDRFQELFGYALNYYKWTFSIWADLIHPDDKERVITSRLNKIIYKDEVNWQDEYRFIRADGSVAHIMDRGILLRNTSGTYRMLGAMQDITKRKAEEFALQQSEARLQGVIASQTNYILRTDLNGMYTYYNKKFTDDFAWIHNSEDLIGVYSMHSIMTYDHQKAQNIVAKCIATPNMVYQVEIDKPAKNNGVKTTVWDFICLTDADNQPTEIQCVGIDISERKKIETAYINSLQEKNTILETIGDGFFAVDNNWTVTYWNHHAEESLKKPKSETIGQHLWTLFPNATTSESYKKFHQAFETNRVVHFEDYHPHLKRWYDVSAYPLNNNLSVFFKDITNRKKIEQQIRDSEEVRHLVIDAAMDAIICMDTSGIITVWNPQAEKVFGWKENEMIGRELADTIIPPQHRDSHLIGVKKYHETGQGPIFRNPFEITGIHKRGHEFPIELSVVPIKQKDSEFFCAFIRDITDRKLASNLLKELNDHLQKQAKLLTTSNEDLERYAYVASHDLQEPLRMVTNFLQLLQTKYDNKLDETAQKYINFAVDGAGRMKSLVMDLLEFSKISAAKLPHKLINLNDVVTHIRQALKVSIDESTAAINVQFLPKVLGNESQLSQLFQNLVSNAIKYRGIQQPIIDIGYTEKAEEWQFYVKDNGIGIDAKFFDKIFIIFQRLHNKSEYSGTGIGLTLCKKIVELHGGKIWVESVIGGGSTFYFTILKTKTTNTVKNDVSFIPSTTS